MSSIIKSSERQARGAGAAFNLNDVVRKANEYLEDVQRQADQIRAEAHEDAQQIRQRAEQEGQQAALQAVDHLLQERVAAEMKTILPALQKLVEETEQLQQSWQLHWQQSAVHLATRIAEKIVRHELRQRPQIAHDMLADALQLAVGGSEVEIRLNPADRATLGEAGGPIAQVLSRLAPVTFIEDGSIAPGGCLIDTRHGRIDAKLETQLARIESELNR